MKQFRTVISPQSTWASRDIDQVKYLGLQGLDGIQKKNYTEETR